jgi:hypothetical protein
MLMFGVPGIGILPPLRRQDSFYLFQHFVESTK